VRPKPGQEGGLTLEPGQLTRRRLGRYEIREEIGRGTMGVVYRAHDPTLGRTVALKTVHSALALSEEERTLFEKRFLAEARVSAALAHPGIVVVHDMGHDPEADVAYIALEYLSGHTVAELMASGSALEWHEALRLAARVAEALHHAHTHGVVHRDVKPANIMILPTGEPKVMDFGIAKVASSQLTHSGEFFGTPSYMSPEQALGHPVDARSDIFSLGAVLYLTLTGHRAFDGPNVPTILSRLAHQDPPRPSLTASVPPAVDYLVARSLAKAPAARYPDARSFAEDIEDVRSGRPPRHQAGWIEPPRNESGFLAVATAREPPTMDLRRDLPGDLPGDLDRTRTSPPGRNPPSASSVLVTAVGLLAAALLGVRLWQGLPVGERVPDAAGNTAPPAAAAASPAPSPVETPPPVTVAPAPGRLEIAFEHSLKYGTLKVWVDDELVIEEELRSRVTKKILFLYKKRKGHLEEAISLAPGLHKVRLQVDGEDERWSRYIRGRFRAGQTRRLAARLDGGGLIGGRELDLVWGLPR